MKIGVIIQARLGSTRMPGKVIINLPLSGNKNIIDHIISRIPENVSVVIATSKSVENDILAEKYDNIFRGEEENVLKRFYDCSKLYGFDQIIRLTGDNPIIDTEILTEIIDKHIGAGVDYTSTTGLPLGCNFEIISFSALEKSHSNSTSLLEREHVTIHVQDNDKFTKQNIYFESNPNIRLTVDYPSDYALLSIVFDMLGDDFGIDDVLNLIDKYPWLKDINSSNKQLS